MKYAAMISMMAVILGASCGAPDHADGGVGSGGAPGGGVGGELPDGGVDIEGQEPDAGLKPPWCPMAPDAACVACVVAPEDELWCSEETSPCAKVGMVAMSCGWAAPAVDDACIEVGAYTCGEDGRMVCCPGGGAYKANPKCIDGPQDCIDFGPCIASYCGADGACHYNRRASGAPCGNGGACGNGICE